MTSVSRNRERIPATGIIEQLFSFVSEAALVSVILKKGNVNYMMTDAAGEAIRVAFQTQLADSILGFQLSPG